jgi:diguanylate cyclase (GGDEF)-like protein
MAGERILVVDDEESVQRLLQRLCQRQGYEVVLAGSLAEAARCLDRGPFDVCIADLRLPDADGIEVLRLAKRLHPDCEVIILTGHADVQTAVEALRLGAYDYMQKPVNDIQLIPIAIARALERQRLARGNAQLLSDLAAANQELELRRRQQLHSIGNIGHALTGALKYHDVAEVLVQAILQALECDGAAVLLLRQDGEPGPWAMLGTRQQVTPQTQEVLLAEMIACLPEALRPDMAAVAVELLPPLNPAMPTVAMWRQVEANLLAIREDTEGIVVLAHHEERTLDEEELGFFDVLVTQAGIALTNARLFARANELATRDGLTGLYNHRHFFELLHAEISRAERYGQELAVIMLDVDRQFGLKAINDTYGHQAGDEMLCAIARFIAGNIRRADVLARYGGDEFIILAPQTGKSEGLALASRICEQLYEERFHVAGQEVHFAVSVGAAVFVPGSGQDASAVVNLADQGIYLAKEQGGNRVCFVEGPSPEGHAGQLPLPLSGSVQDCRRAG